MQLAAFNGVAEMTFRPTNCPYCGSTRIIPVVDGSLDIRRLTLAAQRKIALGGSFAICRGSPVWACADCEMPNSDPQFVMPADPADCEEYENEVHSAFRSYEPISESTLQQLRGRNLLITISRQLFSGEVDELQFRLLGAEFKVDTIRNGTVVKVESNSLFTRDRFELMRGVVCESQIEGQNAVWPIRIGTSDRGIVAASHATSDTIQVRIVAK